MRALRTTLLLTALALVAVSPARADILTLRCGSGNPPSVYVIDLSAGTMVKRSGGNTWNYSDVQITDSTISGVINAGPIHSRDQIDRTTGTLTDTVSCNPGTCSVVTPATSYQCTKIPDKAF